MITKKFYILEKFYPIKCPNCFNKFKSNKDFTFYRQPEMLHKLPSKEIKKALSLLDTKDIISHIKFLDNFNIDFIICLKCKNITLKIGYAKKTTYDKKEADTLVKNRTYNYITIGTTFSTDEKNLENYSKLTETYGTYLSPLAKYELHELLNEVKTKKKEIKDVNGKIDYLEKLDPKLHSFIKEHLPKKTKESKENNFKKRFKNGWKNLSQESKDFLLTGDLLLDSLIELNEKDLDYSPVVIEFSKALEKELYDKIFLRFREKNVYKGNDLLIKQFIKKERDLTLGEMSHILKNIRNTNYGELKEFVIHKIKNYNSFFDEYKFPRKLEKYIFKFRNKSAHITPLSREDCFECKKYLLEGPIKLLIYFEEQIKNGQ